MTPSRRRRGGRLVVMGLVMTVVLGGCGSSSPGPATKKSIAGARAGQGARIASRCPSAASVSVPGLTVRSTTPRAVIGNPNARVKGNFKLRCAYALPAGAATLSPQVLIFAADFGSGADLGFSTYARLGACASPQERGTSCTTHPDPRYTEYSKTVDEVRSIEVDAPLGSNSSMYKASPATRLAAFAMAVRNQDWVCGTGALTIAASEDAQALQAFGRRVARAVEGICGR
jgi:hypothetical protein